MRVRNGVAIRFNHYLYVVLRGAGADGTRIRSDRDKGMDSVTGLRWDPVNSTHAMPNSLFLSSPPAFFAGYAWPWIDPTAATAEARVKTLPAKARYDAGTPNANPW